jgi:hypothetical protein
MPSELNNSSMIDFDDDTLADFSPGEYGEELATLRFIRSTRALCG